MLSPPTGWFSDGSARCGHQSRKVMDSRGKTALLEKVDHTREESQKHRDCAAVGAERVLQTSCLQAWCPGTSTPLGLG